MVFCNKMELLVFKQEKKVTILILIDGFLQLWWKQNTNFNNWKVTILILIDGFLQYNEEMDELEINNVTILILIDGFLQSSLQSFHYFTFTGHNPYFNRWFSAI